MSVPRRRTAADMNSNRPVYDMPLPFDPDTLTQRAREFGFGRVDAAVFAHLALEKVREIAAQNHGQPVTAQQIADAIKTHAAAEVRRQDEDEDGEVESGKEERAPTILDDMEMEIDMHSDPMEALRELDNVALVEEEFYGQRRKRFGFTRMLEEDFFDGQDPYDLSNGVRGVDTGRRGKDLISNICQNIELAVELGKYLDAEDILALYRANRAFYYAVNGYLMSSVRSWITHHCPEAARVFNYKLYKKHLTPDPSGRSWGSTHKVRSVPGLKYLQLVMGRDRYCREILAVLARNGHRTPATMQATLLRLWLLMELATSAQREALLRNHDFWSDYDLYNAQFFLVKLGMHFNDPVYGPNTWDLVHLMMGQKGLYPLWQLLTRKRYKTVAELLELRVRYDLQVPPDHWGQNYFDKTIHGVPFAQVGIQHLEGWGLGERHLMRPDELIPVEAVARGLELDEHLIQMMLWGYFKWDTGENLIPSLAEMHISKESQVLGSSDVSHHWTPRHVLKKNFASLSREQQREIIEDDEDKRLRAMAWCGDDDDDDDDDGGGYDEDDAGGYRLDDEIDRGFIVPHQERGYVSQVPRLDDREAWVDFVNEAMIGLVPEVGEDEKLRAEAWENYQDAELEGDADWSWSRWLREQQPKTTAAADDDDDDDDEEV